MNNKAFAVCMGVLLFVTLVTGCGITGVMETPLVSSPTAPLPALDVDEYAVVKASEDTPDHFDFIQRIPPEVRDRYGSLRYQSPEAMVYSRNQLLEPFGYSLRQNPIMSSYAFQVYQWNKMVLDGISWIGQVTVNESGDNFILPVETGDRKRLLLQSEGTSAWETPYANATTPLYAGNDLVYARYTDDEVEVVRKDEQVLFSVPAQMTVDSPLKGFHGWQGKWVLEVDGKVFLNGTNFNRQMGYDRVYHWQLLDGQPIFFFEKKDGKGKMITGLSYAGQELPNQYDDVIHYRCCEPAAFNPGSNEHMLWFYALKDGVWYYVQAGHFSQPANREATESAE